MFKKAKQPSMLQQRVLEIAQRSSLEVVKKKRTERAAERYGTWQQCWLKGGMGFQISCILIDYSPAGARLRFHSRQDIPMQVTLFCPALGIHEKAERVWAHDGDMGLRYI